MIPDLVCLGNLIVDDVVLADGRTRLGEPGGGMLYATLGAALWGCRVAVVAPVGHDYPRDTLDALASRGVDLSGLRPLGRGGLRTWLLYGPSGRRVVHQAGSPTHDVASPRPEDLSAELARAPAFHLAPVPLDCQARMAEAIGGDAGAHVSLDPHEPVTVESLGRWRDVLARLDLLFASEEEVRLPGMEAEPAATLRGLAGGRLRAIAIKRGAGGGRFLDLETDHLVDWPARATTVVDPTGAGDAFAGGFLSGWLERRDLGRALARGVVSASFALEAWGAAALLAATREQAERRYDAWRAAFIE